METIDGPGYPVHVAGRAQTTGYGDPQRTAESTSDQNIRTVSERLTALVDETRRCRRVLRFARSHH